MHSVFEKEKSTDFLYAKVLWRADFEPNEEDVEYYEFVKWSKEYLLQYEEINIDTIGINTWNDILKCNAKSFDEIVSSEEVSLHVDYNISYSINRNIVMHREKGESYTNYTIISESDGSSYGVHGYHTQNTAHFSNTTGDRFKWDCIANVDGVLSKIDKQYLDGYMEDSETWISTDSLIVLMRNKKPYSDPYIKEINGEKYLCLFYQAYEINPGYNLPFPYEVSIPLDIVISYFSDRGNTFL